ncbi:hypothetical protein VPH35_108879 [Triticum aestivum]
MDAKEARIRADAEEATKETAAAHRAAAEEARRKHQLKEELEAVRKWVATGDPEAAAYRMKRLNEDHLEMFMRRSAEDGDPYAEEDHSDPAARQASTYRRNWKSGTTCGRVLSTAPSSTRVTSIPAMRFTDVPAERSDGPDETLQIFSVKVAEIAEELRWPLDVYGLIAIRDKLDRNRNVIFAFSRDNAQTITKEDPYLSLIGPTRAVVLSSASDTLRFEVVLKVKGTNESEDKDFSFLTRKYRRPGTNHSCVINLVGTSRLSKLEWTFGYLVKSVEATINIQVIHGSWPNGCQGIFTASTVGLDDMKVLLLSLQNEKLPFNVDGMINLSRHVVSVEIEGGLKIMVATENAEGKQVSAKDETVFTPREAGRSCAILKVCSCVMKVVVAWSVVSWF